MSDLRPQPLPDEIGVPLARAATRLGPFGHEVRWYPAVPSTNDIAAAWAEHGAPEGCVVVADGQSAGRGRQGRDWASPLGAGLYVSMVLRPTEHVLPLLTIAAGVGLSDGIHAVTGLAPGSEVAQRCVHQWAKGSRECWRRPPPRPAERGLCWASGSTCRLRPIHPRSLTSRRALREKLAGRWLVGMCSPNACVASRIDIKIWPTADVARCLTAGASARQRQLDDVCSGARPAGPVRGRQTGSMIPVRSSCVPLPVRFGSRPGTCDGCEQGSRLLLPRRRSLPVP